MCSFPNQLKAGHPYLLFFSKNHENCIESECSNLLDFFIKHEPMFIILRKYLKAQCAPFRLRKLIHKRPQNELEMNIYLKGKR